MASSIPPIAPPPTGWGPLAYFKRHPVGFWFIFWGELAERCAYYGVRALFVLYMTDVLFFSTVPSQERRDELAQQVASGEITAEKAEQIEKDERGKFASNIGYIFKALCYYLPLLGGLIADRYLGKYWTIVLFAVPYVFGPILLGVPIPWVYYVGLGILAIGTGVIKPNISTLMGMTYDQKRPGDEQLRTDAFYMFYFAINVGSTFSYLVLPIISKHYDYQVAFAIPTVLMAVALGFFALGKKHYAVEVIVRRKATPEERAERWRVLGRIMSVFAMIVLWWSVYDMNDVTWTLFIKDNVDLQIKSPNTEALEALPATSEDASWLAKRWSGVQRFCHEEWRIQANQPHSLNPILVLLLVPGVNLFFKWIDPTGKRFPSTRKIMMGFLIMGLTYAVMASAGFLWESSGERVSLWWIVLAFVLLTTSEVLVSTIGLELAFSAAPNNMKSFVTACFLATVGIGNSLDVPIGWLYTGNEDLGIKSLGPGLFFAMLAAVMVVLAAGIVPVGRKFNRARA